jgi:hypothetical protein
VDVAEEVRRDEVENLFARGDRNKREFGHARFVFVDAWSFANQGRPGFASRARYFAQKNKGQRTARGYVDTVGLHIR